MLKMPKHKKANPKNSTTTIITNDDSGEDTEVYLCTTCKLDVKTNSIQCDRCKGWVHAKQACSGLPTKLVNELYNYKGDAIEYVCNSCRSSPSEALNSLDSIRKSISQLFETVQGLARVVGGLTSPERTNAHMCPAPDADSLRSLIRQELIEIKERDKRKNSVVVRGINYNSEGAFLHEFNKLTQALINKTIVPTDITPIKTNFVRMKIENNDDRLSLISSSPGLRNVKDFSHIYVSKDLTYQQRTILRERRQNRRTSSNTPRTTGANSIPITNISRESVSLLPQNNPPPSSSLPSAPPASPNIVNTTSPFQHALNFFSPASRQSNNNNMGGSPNVRSAVSSGNITEG